MVDVFGMFGKVRVGMFVIVSMVGMVGMDGWMDRRLCCWYVWII